MIREYRLIVGSATDIKINQNDKDARTAFSLNESYAKDCIE